MLTSPQPATLRSLEILWGWLFSPSEKGCPALKCAWGWLKDPEKEKQNREKLGIEGIESWTSDKNKDLVEALKKLGGPMSEIEKEEEELHEYRMNMATRQQEILKVDLGTATREAYDILNICKVSDDTRWKQGGWAGSVAKQRKEDLEERNRRLREIAAQTARAQGGGGRGGGGIRDAEGNWK